MTSFLSTAQLFAAQKKHSWFARARKLEDRIIMLRKLEAYLEKNVDQVYQALKLDLQRNQTESQILEIFPIISELRHTMKELPNWIQAQIISTPLYMLGASSEVRYEAKGACLIIAPWNYPFQLALMPVISALAAGNTITLKPSEFAPHTAQVIKDWMTELYAPEDVSVVLGDHTVATELLTYNWDHIFFTGSTEIGKVVMAAAAKNLSSVTLELGGKSPAVLAPDLINKKSKIQRSARKIWWGKCLNAGQTCIAPDYVLLPQELSEAFAQASAEAIMRLYGNPAERMQQSADYGRIINRRHFDRLSRFLDEAVDKGARVVFGGTRDSANLYFSPTLITNVPSDCSLMKEEIFGPILPIVSYQTLDEALQLIQSRPKPLALYLFCEQRPLMEKVLSSTSAGGTVINDVMVHFANHNLPFGGVGPSGAGNYHGWFGFKAFCHEKAVLKQGRLNPTQLIYPPYNKRTKTTLKLMNHFLL